MTGDTSVGAAVCTWTADIGQADAEPFEIHIVVGDHYIDTSDTEVVVTVAKPLDNFITGGGYLEATDSGGVYASGEGEKVNFGFNVKFNKNGKALQGRMTIIVRGADGHKYKIKTTAMESLGVILGTDGEEPHYAEFQSKANLTDLTDDNGAGDNLTLLARMWDNGEPGNVDTVGFTLWDSSGELLFSSNWSGVETVQQTIGGGNVQVR